MKKSLIKYSALAIIAIIAGILVNQLAIQLYLNMYMHAPLLDKLYHPINAYKITQFFYAHNVVYNEAGENIIIATCLGIFLAYIFSLIGYRKYFNNLYN